MIEKTVTKFECEYCHRMYDNESTAIACEKEHESLKPMPIKRIYIDENDEISVVTYPNAIYNEDDDCILLYENSLFSQKSAFNFDEIWYDDNMNLVKLFTANLDENYEKECIKKLVDYKINVYNHKINKLKNNNRIHRLEHK